MNSNGKVPKRAPLRPNLEAFASFLRPRLDEITGEIVFSQTDLLCSYLPKIARMPSPIGSEMGPIYLSGGTIAGRGARDHYELRLLGPF